MNITQIEHTSAEDLFTIERDQRRASSKLKNAQRREVKKRKAEQAAEALGKGGAEDLDLTLLLQDLPGDQETRFIKFVLPCEREIILPRMLLRKTAAEVRRNSRMKADLRAWADAEGLHLRWATGGLTLNHRRPLDRWERRVLVVPFGEQHKERQPDQSGVWPIVTTMDPKITVMAGGSR